MASTQPNASSPLRVRFAEFDLDEANARLRRDGTPIPLSPTPFGLLCALVRQAGSLLTKNALLDEVWGHRFVSDSVLKGGISDIRTALRDDPRAPRFIETAARRGYRFIAATTALDAVDPRPVSREATPIDWSVSVSAGGNDEASARTFIGRAPMLERLRRSWERAAGGSRAIVWIAGEPGIGKTALIERFASALPAAATVRGQCVQQYGAGEPYHAVLEAIAELCRRDPTVPAILRTVAPTLLLQLPWVSTAEERDALRRELAGANPERILREIGEFFDRYTQDRPLLLVTEDLHWSDRPTLNLIDFLARRHTRARLMWVSSFRLTEVIATEHPLSTLRHELLLHRLCDEIVLDSFSETEIAAYLAERWPSIAADDDIVRSLHDRTEGVPLFVSSMVSDIASRSAASGVSTAELLTSSPIPENLLAIIDHYSSRLGQERSTLLSAAAVCGVDFRVDVLAKVLERDDVEIADECERLLRERLWLAPGRGDAREDTYSFRHALFRQVLYDRMPASGRADLHRKVGTVLKRERASGMPVSPAQLASHFDLGRTPLDALRYYAEAAEAALNQLSPAECLSLTERALRLVPRAPPDSERVSLEITLATLRGIAAFHVLGAGDEARQAYMRGHALLAHVPLHPLRGLLVQGGGQMLNLRAEFAEALSTAERADGLAAETGDAVLKMAASAVRGQAYMLQGQPQAARESLESALPASDSAASPSERRLTDELRAALLTLLSIQLTHLGLVAEARKRMEEAYAVVERLGHPVSTMVTVWCDALVQIRLGDTARLAALAQQMSELVDKFSLAQGRTACRWFQGLADARRGEAKGSFERIRAAYEQNTALGMIAGGGETLGYAAEVLALQGEFEGAEQQLEQALGIVDRYGERIYLPQLLLTRAVIADGKGQPDAARASIRGAIEESRAQKAPLLELIALTQLCEHSAATADDRRALGSLVSALPQASDTPVYARARALLDRPAAPSPRKRSRVRNS